MARATKLRLVRPTVAARHLIEFIFGPPGSCGLAGRLVLILDENAGGAIGEAPGVECLL